MIKFIKMKKIHEWLKYDWQLKLISLLIAILLWLYVTAIQTPQITKVFMVPIHYYGLSTNFIVDRDNRYVSVYLRGPKSIIDHVEPQELNVFLDLSKIEKPGKYNISVSASVQSGLNLVKIEPKSLGVKVYKATIKFFLIKPTFLGEKIRGYKLLFTPNLVKVKGKKEDIDHVKYVTLFLPDSILKEHIQKKRFLKIMKIYPITDYGEIVEGIKLEPKIVEVIFEKKEGGEK